MRAVALPKIPEALASLDREVADAIPNGRYLEIPDTGHLDSSKHRTSSTPRR
jgi:hypothetical protein